MIKQKETTLINLGLENVSTPTKIVCEKRGNKQMGTFF